MQAGHKTIYHARAKGQLISKGLFDVIVSTKKPTKTVSDLGSKKRSEQTNKGILYH